MPTPATLLAFAAAAGILIVIPGPNLLFLVTRSVADGRAAGLRCAFGFETGTLVHITAAAVGLSALLASSATAFGVVRYAGAAYLLFLGLTTLRRRDDPDAPREPATPPSDPYRAAILVQVLNPKVAVFFLAFLPQFIDPNRSTVGQAAILGVTYSAMELGVNLVTATGASWVAGRLPRRRAGEGWGRRAAGLTYLGLGALAVVGPAHRGT
jgi:threonine/homoserine/homoserine lactone efflux protein